MLVFYFILQTKWCPAPGCEYAVDYVIGSDNFDVTCRCTHYFCWNVSIKHLLFPFLNKHEIRGYQSLKYIFDYMLLQCTEEAHRPLNCDTVGKWILKNSAESENTNWYDFCFCFFGNEIQVHNLAVIYLLCINLKLLEDIKQLPRRET